MSDPEPVTHRSDPPLVQILVGAAGGAMAALVGAGPTEIVQVGLLLTAMASLLIIVKRRRDGRPWGFHAAAGVLATTVFVAVAFVPDKIQPITEKPPSPAPPTSPSQTPFAVPPASSPSPVVTPTKAVASAKVTIAEGDSASIFGGALRVDVTFIGNPVTLVLATSTEQCESFLSDEPIVIPGGNQVWYRISLLRAGLREGRERAQLLVEQYATRPPGSGSCT